EVLFFGGLFLAYAVYRYWFPSAFSASSHKLDLFWGTLNTAILLTSSLTMALALRAIEKDDRKACARLLWGTMFFGLVFLGIKGWEYRQKWVEHLLPGFDFHPAPPLPPQAQIFFCLYFFMTGLHALHLAAGIGLLGFFSARASDYSARRDTPLELA